MGTARMETLGMVAPEEFLGGEYLDTPAFAMRDTRVLARVDGCEVPWPGSHRNVNVWWLLEGGHAVGFNENPSRGWSFPVVRLDEGKVRGLLESEGVVRYS